MTFTVVDHRARLAAPTAQLAPQEAPAAIETATTLRTLDCQRRFGELMETRGSKPAPARFLPRLFGHEMSWALLPLGVGALVAAPAAYLFGLAGLGIEAGVAGGLSFCSALWIVTGPDNNGAPLNTWARHRHLTPSDLAFVGDDAERSALEKATLGLLAERWMARINTQFVHGDAAFATLEQLAADGHAVSPDVRDSANAIVALRDAMLDPSTGQPWRELRDVIVAKLIAAFGALPEHERRAVGPELVKLYFKGEVPRLKVSSHESGRALYRALRDCAAAKADEQDA